MNAFLGLSDSDQSVDALTAQDWLGVQYTFAPGINYMVATSGDDAPIPASGAGTTVNLAVGVDYHFEIIRESPTSLRVEVFDDPGFSVSRGSHTASTGASVQALPYIKLSNRKQGADEGSITATIDDVQLFDGVGAAP